MLLYLRIIAKYLPPLVIFNLPDILPVLLLILCILTKKNPRHLH